MSSIKKTNLLAHTCFPDHVNLGQAQVNCGTLKVKGITRESNISKTSAAQEQTSQKVNNVKHKCGLHSRWLTLDTRAVEAEAVKPLCVLN